MSHRYNRKLGHHVGWLYDETWRANIYLIWNVDEAKVAAFIKQQFGCDYKASGTFNAKCIEIHDDECTAKQGPIVICLSKFEGRPEDWAVLAHEALHATHFLLSARRLTLSDQTDEAYCYLMDSIIRRCGQMLTKSNRK